MFNRPFGLFRRHAEAIPVFEMLNADQYETGNSFTDFDLQSIGQPANESAAVDSPSLIGSYDLSELKPRQLADYSLAVTALQLDGREVMLSEIMREEALSLVERTHHDLLMASADALTKELLPGHAEFGTAGPDDNEAYEALLEQYIQTNNLRKYDLSVTNFSALRANPEMGKAATDIVWAMRFAIEVARLRPAEALTISADLMGLSAYFFNLKKGFADNHEVRDNGGWRDFSRTATDFALAQLSSTWEQQVVLANRLINCVHNTVVDGVFTGSILERFTSRNREPEKVRQFLDVMNATDKDYKTLARHAGCLGLTLAAYLDGDQKLPEMFRNQPAR